MTLVRDTLDERTLVLGAIVALLLGVGSILLYDGAVVTTLGALVIILGIVSFMLAFGVYLGEDEVTPAD